MFLHFPFITLTPEYLSQSPSSIIVPIVQDMPRKVTPSGLPLTAS